MQGKTTLPELYDRIREMEEQHHDSVVSANQMNFGSLHEVNIDGISKPMQSQCSELLCRQIRVPYGYLKRCSRTLQSDNLNYWFRKLENKELLVRFDGDEVRAIVTPRYKPVANSVILESFLQSGYTGEVSYAIDPMMMKVDIPDFHSSFEIAGERHKGGISIINGETSWYAFSIQAFILRLICSNGMISEVREKQKYRHVSEGLVEKIPQMISGAVNQLQITQNRMSVSVKTPIDNPEATFSSFNRRFQLTKAEIELVKKSYYREKGETMYFVVQAYTSAANESGISLYSRYKLQRIGGTIVNLLKN